MKAYLPTFVSCFLPGLGNTCPRVSESKRTFFWLSEDEQGHRDPRTIEDAEEYVLGLAQQAPVSEMLVEENISREILAKRVAQASQGNFLYLHHYAQGVRSGDMTLLDLESLPEGLYGIYADFLSKIKQQREDVPWDSAYKPVLGALAVSREPVTRAQIADFSGVAPGTVGTILAQIIQFLKHAVAGGGGRLIAATVVTSIRFSLD